jgi:hypothetical protein
LILDNTNKEGIMANRRVITTTGKETVLEEATRNLSEGKPLTNNHDTRRDRCTRRAFLGRVGGAAAGAYGLSLGRAAEVLGRNKPAAPGASLDLVLWGIYEHVTHGPSLGLSQVELSDGTYDKTKIYPVNGLTGQPIGTFYVNLDVTLCAYQLRGGAFAAAVTQFSYKEARLGGDVFRVKTDGELYQFGTAELVIPEATGIYREFVGGAIHMEFCSHIIDQANFDEYCVCYITR